MLAWQRMVVVSAVLLLDVGAFLLLTTLSMSYGDVTDLLEDEAYQQSERGVSMGWWLWWGVNAAIVAILLYRVIQRRAAAPSATT